MPLIAYDEDGNIVAVLDKLVIRDADGSPALVDFAAHEQAGGKLRDVWDVAGAVRSTAEPDHAAPRPQDAPRGLSSLPLVGRRR